MFFQFGSVFSGFARFFFDLGSVRFSFFGFRLIKPDPNWLVFSKFNRFFLTVQFVRFIFSDFLDFSVFLLTFIFT
jgi:hypothetical protein